MSRNKNPGQYTQSDVHITIFDKNDEAIDCEDWGIDESKYEGNEGLHFEVFVQSWPPSDGISDFDIHSEVVCFSAAEANRVAMELQDQWTQDKIK